MTDTHTLIARLSSESAVKPMGSPGYAGARLLAVLAVYAFGVQAVLGFRPDLARQFARPFFVLEIALLASLVVASAVASILAMYPDAYQKPAWLRLPYAIFGLLITVIIAQVFMPLDPRMLMPEPGSHAMECAICIAVVALVPSAWIFMILRKGASVRQWQAGSFAVLAASGIGCLTLRLAEPIDAMPHLIYWHYLPTVLFAVIGALIGKWLLKW